MIHNKFTPTIPQEVIENLAPYSKEELAAGQGFVKSVETRSKIIATVYEDETPLFCLGVIESGLMGFPYLWFLLCKDFTMRHAKISRKTMRAFVKEFIGLQTVVEDKYEVGKRFARFYGFRKNGQSAEALGRTFDVYEVRS